ncbi:MAG: hypothetical protein F6K47_18100 [Symploca sp. SIO2E6]|nr:hypothetical protein [Symploca sp. SIO2E6]
MIDDVLAIDNFRSNHLRSLFPINLELVVILLIFGYYRNNGVSVRL